MTDRHRVPKYGFVIMSNFSHRCRSNSDHDVHVLPHCLGESRDDFVDCFACMPIKDLGCWQLHALFDGHGMPWLMGMVIVSGEITVDGTTCMNVCRGWKSGEAVLANIFEVCGEAVLTTIFVAYGW